MDLALNNQRRLIYHKTQTTNQLKKLLYSLKLWLDNFLHERKAFKILNASGVYCKLVKNNKRNIYIFQKIPYSNDLIQKTVFSKLTNLENILF